MRSRFVHALALVLGVALTGSLATPTHATNINIHGSTCHRVYTNVGPTTVARADDVIYSLLLGARVSQFAEPKRQPQRIICPIPRSPLAAGANFGGFWIDGTNSPSDPTVSTSCIMWSVRSDGTQASGVAFTAAGHRYSQFVDIPAFFLSSTDYVALECDLPGSQGSVIGVRVVQ